MKKLKRLSKRLTALILSVVMVVLVTAVQTSAVPINNGYCDRDGYTYNLKCTCGKFDHRLSLGKGESVSYSVGQKYYGSIKIANLSSSRGASDSVKASVKKISPVLSKVTFTGLRNNDGYYDYINMYLSSNKEKQGICHAITVYDAPKFIKLNKTSITLLKDNTYILQEKTNKGSYANNQNIKWTSSNPGVKVKKLSGGRALITAVKKCVAVVTVTAYNGVSKTCKVTVK